MTNVVSAVSRSRSQVKARGSFPATGQVHRRSELHVDLPDVGEVGDVEETDLRTLATATAGERAGFTDRQEQPVPDRVEVRREAGDLQRAEQPGPVGVGEIDGVERVGGAGGGQDRQVIGPSGRGESLVDPEAVEPTALDQMVAVGPHRDHRARPGKDAAGPVPSHGPGSRCQHLVPGDGDAQDAVGLVDGPAIGDRAVDMTGRDVDGARAVEIELEDRGAPRCAVGPGSRRKAPAATPAAPAGGVDEVQVVGRLVGDAGLPSDADRVTSVRCRRVEADDADGPEGEAGRWDRHVVAVQERQGAGAVVVRRQPVGERRAADELRDCAPVPPSP